MQEHLAADAAQPGADRRVDIHRRGPGVVVLVAEAAPLRIAVERAADAARLGRDRVAVPLQPAQAVDAGHGALDQRPAVDLPVLEARLHADDLVERDADPLLDDGLLGRAAPGQAGQRANFPADRHDLVVAGALAPDHADVDTDAPHRPGERRDRRPARAGPRAQQVGAEVAAGDDVDREWQHVVRPQPREVLVDGGGLPAGVGEHGAVGHGSDLTVRRHERERGGLDAGAEAEYAQPDARRRGGEQRHHAASRSGASASSVASGWPGRKASRKSAALDAAEAARTTARLSSRRTSSQAQM